MISRLLIQCLTCSKPTTARIQVGHELEQPVTFACPHCETEIRLSLALDQPPDVTVRLLENCAPGVEEGKIVNIGAGFTISKDKVNEDFYFPTIDARNSAIGGALEAKLKEIKAAEGVAPSLLDSTVSLGGLPFASDYWKIIQKALRFHHIGRGDLKTAQLNAFWGGQRAQGDDLDNTIFSFLMRFLAPDAANLLGPCVNILRKAEATNRQEYIRLGEHYNGLKEARFRAYADILSEFFKGYAEFNQTLVYVRNSLPLPIDGVATSSDFASTRMFYGNAFETLGAHLDMLAAINNIVAGRPLDQMDSMDMRKFLTLSKANRPNCFSNNRYLSWFVSEYDNNIRNASHHRSFVLDDSRQRITYRSGPATASRSISYAEYLYKCNRLAVQLMIMICWELVFLQSTNNRL